MPRLHPLSWEQRAHIHGLARVRLIGVDLSGCPVITRADVNGEVTYAIRRNGTGRDPIDPVLQFEDLDLDVAEVDRDFVEPITEVWNE